MAVLVSILGAYEVVLASSASTGVLVSGLIGGLFVVASPWIAKQSAKVGTALLVVGSLVWAILAWWSIIAPLIALVDLGIGGYILRSAARENRAVRSR